MVSRSAYAQLGYSPWLLAGTVLGMVVTYMLPVLLALFAGGWAQFLGFLARRDCRWAVDDGVERIAVYIPTAPNPTSGYVVLVEASRVKPTTVSPEQALAWAVSGGVIAPSEKPN